MTSAAKSRSDDDLDSDLLQPPVTLMRWPSTAEMRSAQQAAGSNGDAATCKEIVPMSAQEYLYNVEHDDGNASNYDSSSSDNVTSSERHSANVRVSGRVTDECRGRGRQRTQGVGGGGGGGRRDGIMNRTTLAPPPALYVRRQKRRSNNGKDSKAAKTLSAILIAFIVTWLPYNLFILFEAFSYGTIPASVYSVG
jgi:hypothetical protein